MNKTIDTYWSDYYEQDRDFMPASPSEISRFLEPVCTQPKTALDLGCGTGQLSRELFHRGYKVVGIDVSSSAIRRARNFTELPGTEMAYRHLDVEAIGLQRLPFAPYGLVTCRLVFAFIEDKAKLAAEVSNVLAPHGTFVVISPISGHVPAHKEKIAVDREATKALLSEFFSVGYYENHDLGFFICSRL